MDCNDRRRQGTPTDAAHRSPQSGERANGAEAARPRDVRALIALICAAVITITAIGRAYWRSHDGMRSLPMAQSEGH